jgi:hypothetical protein
MTTELSNPFSAGGGGGQFEIKVQAAFLALMVLDGPCPCLPRGTIDSVKLQSKHLGYDVDDLLIPYECSQRPPSSPSEPG